MRHEQIEWPCVGGWIVVGLLIAAVGGMGVFAVLEPDSIEMLVTAEL